MFRPSNGVWFLRHSSGSADEALAFGTSGDIPVPGNCDDDAITDIGVFRTGDWFLDNGQGLNFGIGSEIPLPLPAAIRMAYFGA